LWQWQRLSAYWFRGGWLAKQNPDHPFCLARFDEGIWIAISVHTLAALTGIANTGAEAIMYPLGFFSILSLGISKSSNRSVDGFSGRPSSRTALSSSFVFMLAIGGFSLLIPLLVEPALWTSGKLAGAAFDLIQYFAGIMDRFFALDPAVDQPSGQTLFSTPSSAIGDPEAGTLTYIFLFMLMVATILSVVVLLVAGLFRLLKHLSSVTEKKQGNGQIKDWLSHVLLFWSRFWKQMKPFFMRQPLRSDSALSLYLRYQTLGRLVGFVRKPQETAREYSRRLALACPASAGQAGFVVEAMEKEYYGHKILDTATVRELVAIAMKTRLPFFLAERAGQVLRRAFPGKNRTRFI
jgi:hypothetical protein